MSQVFKTRGPNGKQYRVYFPRGMAQGPMQGGMGGPMPPMGGPGNVGPVGPMGNVGQVGNMGPVGIMGPVGPVVTVGPSGPVIPVGPGGPVNQGGPMNNMNTMNMGGPSSHPNQGPGVPMMGPGNQINSNAPPSSMTNAQASNQQDVQRYDHFNRVRMLVGSLKESLSDVVRVAAMNIYHTAAVDNGVRVTSDAPPPRLDKALEDFFSICNQIEYSLKTIQECTLQNRDSQQYLPVPVVPTKPEPSNHQDNTLSFTQFISTIGAQVAFAKEIQEILADSAKRIQQQQQPQQMFH